MSRSTMNARDLFLSHSSGDAEVARQLRTVLEAAGYSCWMAPDDIVGTETWTEQILAAIDGSRAMVVLVSANANRSAHVSREVNLALGRRRAVLPIRIESVAPEGSLEYLLSLVQRVDAFPSPITDHGERITKRLDALLRPNATPPPPPAPPAKTKADRTRKPDAEPAETKPARRTTRRRAAAPRSVGPIGPGSVVDDFTIETLLGEGGMGRVYRARQAEPNRAVALKVIRPDHAADDTYRRRFLAEKDTLAALEHPSIVPIYAAGEENDVLYIAMRLVDGTDLQARITAQGHLSLRETVQVLRPIADAIDHAHAAGIIHRDLKPSNIILDRSGRPYLTDFGLGKHMEKQSQLSTPGVALGTLDYMAPEQFTGGSDPTLANRIDVYALGCVVYSCLTGRPPFVRDTPQQLMYAHSHEPPPPPRSIRPELPPAVDEVLARSLAKDPKYRFATATELVAALEAAFTSTSMGQTRPVPVPVGSSGMRGWLRANTPLAVIGTSLAAVAIVVLGAVAIGGGVTPSPSTGPVATRLPTPFVPPPTATPAPTVTPTRTPDSQPFPNSDEETLLARMPEFAGSAATCQRYQDRYPTSIAMIYCTGPTNEDDYPVFYTLFETPELLTDEYLREMRAFGIAAGGNCEDPGPPANAPWSYGTGAEVGKLACFVNDGRMLYIWTHVEREIHAQWLAPDNAQGLAFWKQWATAVRP